jgi:membrane protein DedA with SNARE-associated domain
MTDTHLPGVFGDLQPVLGEMILIAAAVFAGSGHMNITLVILVAVLGAIIGDNIGFAVGHFDGRPLVERFVRYVVLTPERLDHAGEYFNEHGGKIVTIARFIEGLRQLNGFLAGIVGVHWAKFLAFNALGAVLWVCTWAGVGYLAGENIVEIYAAFDHYKWYVIAALAVVVAILITRRVRRRRARALA